MSTQKSGNKKPKDRKAGSTLKPRRNNDRGREEESTQKSKKSQIYKKKAKSTTPLQSPAPKEQSTTPKKKTPAVEEEVPTGLPSQETVSSTATSTLSTLSTGSTLRSSALTPPNNKNMGSCRKSKAGTPTETPPTVKNQVTNLWAGEGPAKSWVNKIDYNRIKSDYDKIQSVLVNVDKDCKKWKANAKWNQSEDYPAFDSKLVKVDNEYANISQIDASLGRPILLGQLPVKDSEETFWKIVFEKRATSLYIIIGNESADFFPQNSEEYKTYGQMWINNRRADTAAEDVRRFLIEVLPHGCSNSIVCNVTLIKNWENKSVHNKFAVVVKEANELNMFLEQSPTEETALIISKHGAGRAGYFLALTVGINKFNSKIEPCIFDIVRKIRTQRPKTVESLTQYASLYVSLLYFIRKKIGDESDPLYKKAKEMAEIFKDALAAENEQSQMEPTNTNAGSAVMSLTTFGQK